MSVHDNRTDCPVVRIARELEEAWIQAYEDSLKRTRGMFEDSEAMG